MIITNNLNKKKIIILASILSVVAGIIFVVFMFRDIFQYHDAQGGLALFFAPIFFVVAIIVSWIIIFSILYLLQFLYAKIKHQPTSTSDKFLAVVSTVMIILSIIIIFSKIKQYFLEGQAESDTIINQEEFYQLYKNAIDNNNIGVLSRIAKNPNTPVELLSQLFNSFSINCVKGCSEEEKLLISSTVQKTADALKREFPYMTESAFNTNYNIVVDPDATERSFVDYKSKIATLTKIYPPTIAHEISHLLVAEYFGMKTSSFVSSEEIFYPNGPAWLQEGLAMYLEYHVDDARRQESVINRFNIPVYSEDFESGSDLTGWYSASWIMVRDLIEQDRDKFRQLVDCAKNLLPLSPPLPTRPKDSDKSWEQCFNEIYKTEWKSFYEKWSLNNRIE